MPSARKLIELGMPAPAAVVMAAQFTANVGVPRRLIEVGVTPAVAHEIQTQLAGTANAQRLVERGVVPPLAAEMAAQIAE